MMRESLVVLLLPALFLLLQAEIAEGGAFRSFRGGGTSYNNNQQYRANNYYKTGNVAGGTEGGGRSPESEKQTSNNKGTGKEPGISAWGIIAVVIGVILLGTGGYYAFVFYPYLCKKQRSYDMIELTDVL